MYTFPVKAIVQILIKEFDPDSVIGLLRSQGAFLSDELKQIIRDHGRYIESLKTYEEINTYLIIYRGLTLQEWVDSL